jgi:hypothetical protein
MGLPTQPVTLTVEQIEDLNKKLGALRHDINNNLSLIIAAAEMVRFKPDLLVRMMDTLNLQPPRISNAVSKFTDEFEKAVGITRP